MRNWFYQKDFGLPIKKYFFKNFINFLGFLFTFFFNINYVTREGLLIERLNVNMREVESELKGGGK